MSLTQKTKMKGGPFPAKSPHSLHRTPRKHISPVFCSLPTWKLRGKTESVYFFSVCCLSSRFFTLFLNLWSGPLIRTPLQVFAKFLPSLSSMPSLLPYWRHHTWCIIKTVAKGSLWPHFSGFSVRSLTSCNHQGESFTLLSENGDFFKCFWLMLILLKRNWNRFILSFYHLFNNLPLVI